MMSRAAKKAALALCVIAFAAAPALAFGEGGHGGHHEASIVDLKWYFLNFALYCTALYFIVRKKAAAGWASRCDRLAAEVKARAEEMRSADEELRAAELQLQSLPGEVNNLKNQIALEAEHEVAQAAADAQKRSERLSTQTRDSLAAERRAAESSIQRELADAVVKRAADKLKSSLTVEADQALRTRAVDGVKQLVQ